MIRSLVRVSTPEKLFLVPRASGNTPESALVVPELRAEVPYFLCLADSDSLEEHAVALLEHDDDGARELVRRSLNLRRPRKVSFWRLEEEGWIGLHLPSRAAEAAGLVCAHLDGGFEPPPGTKIHREGLTFVVTFG